MSMRAPDLIHALTFDFEFAALAPDSLELADWVKADLLPVVEEVLDISGGTGRRRRIERLEIDLGTVSAAQSHSELARRLFVQLSHALAASMEPADAANEPGEPGAPGAPMLAFLRSGRMAWAAADATGAHKQLLRQLIDSPQAHAVLSVAMREPDALSRLIRQFDAEELMAAAGVLFETWPRERRGAALAWAADELRRLGGAGGDTESFWRWFLPRHEQAASVDALLREWTRVGRGAPDAPAQALAPGVAGTGFTRSETIAIGQGLETAHFALLAPYWERVLSRAPQLLRDAHPRLWKRWLQNFGDDALADILAVMQADCCWLIERVSTVLPRPRLNTLLRPALRQWLAAPADSLEPQVVLEWINQSAPGQSGRILALFAAPEGWQGRRDSDRMDVAGGGTLQRSDAQLSAAARDLFEPWPQARRDAVLKWAGHELRRLREAGLDSASFWRWFLPQYAQPASVDALLQEWIRVDREASATQAQAQANAPAVAGAGDAPSETRLLPEQTDGIRALSAADVGGQRAQRRERAADTASVMIERSDAQLLSTARDLFEPWPQAQRDAVLAWAGHELRRQHDAGLDSAAFWRWFLPKCAHPASLDAVLREWTRVGRGSPDTQARADASGVARPGFSPSEIAIIGHGLETAQFALLAPYWERVLAHAPQWLRDDHPRLWQQWLQNFDDNTLVDILRVLQADCSWHIERLSAVLPRPAMNELLRPALQQWLAAPADSLAPQRVLEWIQEAAPEESARILALFAAREAGQEAQGREPVDSAGSVTIQHSDAQLLSTARLLFEPWPQAQRDAVLDWAGDELRRLRDAGVDSASFWRWFLPHYAHPVSLDTLLRDWAGGGRRSPERQAGADAPGAAFPPPDLGAVGQGPETAQFALPAPSWKRADHILALFAAQEAGPGPQERQPEGAAGSAVHLERRMNPRATQGPRSTSFHLAPEPLVGHGAQALEQPVAAAGTGAIGPGERRSFTRLIEQSDAQQRLATAPHAHPILPDALVQDFTATPPGLLAASFTADEADAIHHGLANAQFHLLAPYWDRLLAGAAPWICAAHPQLWRTWLASFDDDVLMDILSVVQADCTPMIARMAGVIARERLLPLMRPALPAWFGAAPHRLSPHVILMHVMKSAPQHADALSALYHGQEPGRSRAAAGQHAAVDSRHFREPLRVLGPIFARAEIISISKCLNEGEFGPLAPHWDRLLILAPHWLRSEYPRLARTWLAGFDDEVLIDILSVVQADCCALVERLASALPREQLHAALRSSLPRWFDVGLDRLEPRAVIGAVLRAMPGRSSELHALMGLPPGRETDIDADTDAAAPDPAWLEDALERGDVDQLRRMWHWALMSQRGQFRRIWEQLPRDKRTHAIDGFTTQLSLAQQADIAVILQPRVAQLMAELEHQLGERQDGAAMLRTALQFLLHAEVGCAVPEGVMHAILEQHAALATDLPAGATRHIAAALLALHPTPGALAPSEQAGALEPSHLSEEALRAHVAACLREDARLGQFDSARLHRLVRAWAGFQRDGGARGAFLPAIEAAALRAACPHAFFGKVLRQAVLGEPIDLDEIGAARAVIGPAPVDELLVRQFDPDVAGAPAPTMTSPLPEQVRLGLPRRLADAMLRADLSALDDLWPAIAMHHRDLLGQAARRYLGRAEARERLIAGSDAGKVNDVLGALSWWAAQLISPLLDRAARFNAMLPTPLAPAAFQRRVLRFAFGQVMDHPAETANPGWVFGLLRAVLPAQSPQADPAGLILLAHAWYELLRGEGGTPALNAALEDTLFGRQYLEVALRRLRPGTRVDLDTSVPETLQLMLTTALCDGYPALTDQLLADGMLATAQPAVFGAAEWQALARAQLPRQDRAAQLAFWREFAAHLPAPAASGGAMTEAAQVPPGEDALPAAFAAAFGVIGAPAAPAPDAMGALRATADAGFSAPAADVIAILLMRESAPDDAARASIGLLTQRLLATADADAGAGIGATAHAALQSALSDHEAIGRLVAILSGPTLARLLAVLQPGLASALPAVLRAIAGSLPVALSNVPATLDSGTWAAIYEAIFTGRLPAGGDPLLGAVAQRLAARQPPAEGTAWLQRIARLELDAGPLAPATPAEAMAQLLQPLALPQPDPAPPRAVRVEEEPVAFTGDANLRNAGLVIIAPYIERLFDLLDIARDGVFLSEETRQRGVHLLQYVVTAEESTPEYQLTLNKLLCGMPAGVPVVQGISMTQKEKDTIDQMLKGVIANWSAIGSSSVEGLRETFLQREGCLYYQEEAWHLKVPQLTFDMLLDRLPWGYKLIRFAWMAAPLNVTWR